MGKLFSNVMARAILLSVVVAAVVYKGFKRFVKTNGENTRKFVKDHPAVEETLTVAMFVGAIGVVLAMALPASHLVVGVLY